MEIARRQPKVTIIIPVRNAERTLDKTFEYLDALDYPRSLLQILIADGGSSDGTIEVVQRWQIRRNNILLVQIPNCASPGHARNEALKHVSGEFVLFTDGDCAPQPDWIHELLRPFFVDMSIGAVGGEVLTLRTDPENETESYCEQVRFLSVAGRCGVWKEGYLPIPTDMAPHEVNGGDHSPFFATANVAFRRTAIDEAGGAFWHEPTGEDVDFSLRVQRKGYQLYFNPKAVVRHMHRVSLDSYLRQWYGYGFGHPLLIEKHAADMLEVVVQVPRPVSLKLPLKTKGIVHLGAFQAMHIFLAATFLTGMWRLVSASATPSLLLSLALTGFSALVYFAPCVKLQPRRKFLTWCKIRYLTNLAFVRGAIDGWRRFGAICIEPSW